MAEFTIPKDGSEPSEVRGASKTIVDNKEKTDPYDELVSQSPQGSIYCRRWWLEAVAPGNWRILTVEKGGKIAAAWPVVTHESKKGVEIVMPHVTQKLGIIYAPMHAKYSGVLASQHKLANQLIEQLPSYSLFTHQFHENFTNWLPFYWQGYSQTTRYTYVLENIEDLDQIWGKMAATERNCIRKAQKEGIRVSDSLDIEQFILINEKTFERQNLKCPIPAELILRLDEAAVANSARKILAAWDRSGRLHAAVYIVWDRGTAYYLMVGSDPDLRSSGAIPLLTWEAIQYAATFADRFDFEGSMIQPIEKAYRNLGGKQTSYFQISKTSTSKNMRRAYWKTPTPIRAAIHSAANYLVELGK